MNRARQIAATAKASRAGATTKTSQGRTEGRESGKRQINRQSGAEFSGGSGLSTVRVGECTSMFISLQQVTDSRHHNDRHDRVSRG